MKSKQPEIMQALSIIREAEIKLFKLLNHEVLLSCNPSLLLNREPEHGFRYKKSLVKKIIEKWEEFEEVPKGAVTSISRQSIYVEVRRRCINYILDNYPKFYTLTEIGSYFNRDHTSIINARDCHDDLMITDHIYLNRYKEISVQMDEYLKSEDVFKQ